MRTIATDAGRTLGSLTVAECLDLLRTESIGRLAVADRGGAPIVVPVNFVVHDNAIVFRSGDGPKLDRIREHPVSVQADRFDSLRRVGWSVLVRGIAHETSYDELGLVELEPWAPGQKAHWVRVVPNAISGRRLQLDLAPLDGRGYL